MNQGRSLVNKKFMSNKQVSVIQIAKRTVVIFNKSQDVKNKSSKEASYVLFIFIFF